MDIDKIVIESIVQSLPVGLAVISPDGEIRHANPQLSEILGYPEERLLEEGWALFFQPEQSESNAAFTQVLVDVIQEEFINLTRSVPYLAPDGRRLQLSVTSSFLRAEGEIAGIVVIIHDMTELHLLHERETRALEERNRIQQQRVESLNKLAQSVAHQIRNPVMSIGGFAGLVLRKLGARRDLTQYLTGIRSEAVRLEDIVKGVTDYASLPPFSPRTVSVEGLVGEARVFLKKRAAGMGRQFVLNKQVETCEVWADPGLTVRALGEVLVNALEAQENEAAIDIQVARDGDWVRFTVSDRGHGIKDRDMPYLFDPFFTTRPQAVGMGLAIVRRIMAEAGGKTDIRSEPGKGTEVTLLLPVPESDTAMCLLNPRSPDV